MQKRGVVSESDVSLLRSAASKGREAVLFGVLYETGCRVHEAVSLSWSDVDVLQRTLRCGQRIVAISPRLAGELSEMRPQAAQGGIFATRQSEMMTTKRARQIVQSVSVACLGRPVSPQELRYAHIAHALERGVMMSRISQQVGLKSVRARQLEGLFEARS